MRIGHHPRKESTRGKHICSENSYRPFELRGSFPDLIGRPSLLAYRRLVPRGRLERSHDASAHNFDLGCVAEKKVSLGPS
jgi:hypothetical protein